MECIDRQRGGTPNFVLFTNVFMRERPLSARCEEAGEKVGWGKQSRQQTGDMVSPRNGR